MVLFEGTITNFLFFSLSTFRPSPVSSNKTKTISINEYDSSMKSLQQELRVTKDNLENISKKREDDLDMYLRLASDSRTMFKQGLKEAQFDKN